MVLIKFISYQLSKATIIQYTYTNDFQPAGSSVCTMALLIRETVSAN